MFLLNNTFSLAEKECDIFVKFSIYFYYEAKGKM